MLQLPYVTEQMLDKAYWVKNVPNSRKIRLSTNQIAQINARICNNKNIGYANFKNFSGISSIPKIAKISTKDFPEDNFINTQVIENNINNAKVYKKVLYGFVTKNTLIKKLPTMFNFSDEYLTNANSFCFATVLINEATVILGISSDNNWFYCKTYRGTGWIMKDFIAICNSKEEWLQFRDTQNFLIVTETTTVSLETKDITLTLGTKLPLIKSFKNNFRIKNYDTLIATKDNNGNFKAIEFKIPTSNAYLGYIPYTQDNILELSFKLSNAVLPSSYIARVFGCFGFILPYSIEMQARLRYNNIKLGKYSNKEKLDIIRAFPVGSIFYLDNNCLIYLGIHYGMPYFISFVYKAILPTERKQSLIKSVVISNLSLSNANGTPWLDTLSNAILLI